MSMNVQKTETVFPFPLFSTGPFIPTENDAQYNFAVSAGAIHGAWMTDLLKAAEGIEDKSQEATEFLVDRLVSLCLVTESEAATLKRIVTYLNDAERSDRNKYNRVQSIYRDFQAQNASPVAIMIAGIAADSLSLVVEGRAKPNWAKADVTAAIAGAGVGTAIGGPVGALIGGLLGGAAASLAEKFG